MMLLIIAVACLAGAVFLAGVVATLPSRERWRSMRRATTYGFVRIASEADQAGFVRIVVEDTGPGIDEADFDKIFEPFRQLQPSMTRTSGGTGLGLAVSRRFAELMGGTVTVESELGRGSRFVVRLPVHFQD